MRAGPPKSANRALALGVLIAVSGACATHSAPIIGRLAMTGALGLTSTTVDFLPAGGGSGAFALGPSIQTGAFGGLGGTTGTVLDLNAPVGVPVSVPNFIVLAAAPTFQVTLTFVAPGIFSSAACGAAPAVGQVCSLPGSAFNFLNTPGGGSALFLTVQGTAVNTLTGETSQFSGTFSTQFSGQSYQQVMASVALGSFPASTASADFLFSAPGTDADLAISKSDGVGFVAPGSSTVYTIVVSNLGPHAATGAPVVDALAPAVTSATWTCSADAGSLCGAASGSGNIATTVDLAPAGTATFLVSVNVSPAAIGTLSNTASVGAGVGTPDPNLANNSATDLDALALAQIPTLGIAGLVVLISLVAATALGALRRAAR